MTRAWTINSNDRSQGHDSPRFRRHRLSSELFYEGRLVPLNGLERQNIQGPAPISGAGLWFVPVVHEGNQSYSAEEVDRVAAITEILTQAGSTWTDRGGNQRPLTIDDILIVAPYNNQVNRLTDRKQNRTQEAKQAYEEALQIFREFAQKNPEAYLPDVATTLNDLGVLDRDQKRMEEARKELDETLQIRRELVQKNPEAYLPDVAETLNNMGVLDRKQNRAQEAKQAYEKALEIYEVIAKQDPQRFSADVARMKQLLVGVTEVSYGCVPAGPAKPQIKARIIETVICPRTAHGLVE